MKRLIGRRTVFILLGVLALHVSTMSLSVMEPPVIGSNQTAEYDIEIYVDSSQKGVQKRAAAAAVLAGAVAVAPIVGAIFSGGSFLYGLINGQMRLAELRKINRKLDTLQKSVDELNEKVKSLQLGQQWLEGAAIYAKDVQRLRFILHQMKDRVTYCESSGAMVLKSTEQAQNWADTVLDDGPDGLRQIMFSMHDLVMGAQLFGKRSLVSIYKDMLESTQGVQTDTDPGTYTKDMEEFVEYIMALETGGYAAISTAMNIRGIEAGEVDDFIENMAVERMTQQWERISEITGIPQAWTEVSSYTPPFHIAADGYGDLGARFVDLNGDGKIDMVYYRWINGNAQQKGSYISRDFFGDHTKNSSSSESESTTPVETCQP